MRSACSLPVGHYMYVVACNMLCVNQPHDLVFDQTHRIPISATSRRQDKTVMAELRSPSAGETYPS